MSVLLIYILLGIWTVGLFVTTLIDVTLYKNKKTRHIVAFSSKNIFRSYLSRNIFEMMIFTGGVVVGVVFGGF